MTELETLTTTQAPTKPAPSEPMLDEGDHDRFAHYVKKDKILPSAIEGTALVALCGKKWVPTRDPKRYPVCPECKEIFEMFRGGKGDGDQGGDDASGGDGS